MRKSWVIAAAALLVALAGGWYFASPAYTLSRMKAAAEARDDVALARNVDFPALRESLKAGMTQAILAEEDNEGGFGKLGSGIAMAMMSPMIDNMVSPAGLKAMLARRAPAESGGKGAKAEAEEVEIDRVGLSEFRLGAKGREGAMIFTRHGLGWKLSGVDLPRDAASR